MVRTSLRFAYAVALFPHLMGILPAYLLLELSAHPWQLGTHGSPRATVNEVLLSPHNYHHPKCSDTSLSFLPSVPPFSALLISLLPHRTPHLPVPHPALRWPVVQPGPTQPDGRAPSHSAKTARNTICRGFFQGTALQQIPFTLFICTVNHKSRSFIKT